MDEYKEINTENEVLDLAEFSDKKAEEKKSKKIKKPLLHIIISLGAVGLVMLGVLTFALLDMNGNFNKKDTNILIEKGTPSVRVAEILEENGVIKSSFIFRVYSKLNGYDSKFQYGAYDIKAKSGYKEIATKLITEGAVLESVTVTIPEGTGINDYVKDVNGKDVTVPGIATLLSNAGVCSKEDFFKALKNAEYNGEIFASVNSENTYYALEGYLFPDTYEFYSYNSEECAVLAVNKMLSQMEKVIDEDIKAKAKQKGMSINELLTLASVVQMEAGLDTEGMPKVVAVFNNRLALDGKLGSSPTCYYGRSFSNDDGRYDTYEIKGLPPGPLCSPGKEAINAVLNPEPNFNQYLYFVTDKNGKFYFHKTYDEQNATINRLKKEGNWIYEYLD
ncbi:MAG: endolytic transglycosylase MltG [Ruminococcaceae bacterium]|nr:endolytic transglycosylase MltG [Oscillospiraceae bacterium]